ncbi:MAG: hypothetical protein ATN33_01160 [Epulopiscium sp. Nele67-Bin001]|nr:MAG: hypothetical protein BEN18_05365 [Epulopiscium sp. Nuni2H_MBin001]OON91445.1 MAG: hypothetical protein ATN33_01160 [Epulopiscium sp. Nele67-Bin001]
MNKKLMTVAVGATLLLASLTTVLAREDEDVRAVWITTVYNSDFPKNIDDPLKQQLEFSNYLDELQTIGINTIMVQVRPTADALYESSINPWSNVLTGVQGQYPGYDPLAFMVHEAHKRNMEIHAWLNPYRVTTKGQSIDELSVFHPAVQNPSWTFEYNEALYYNPELEVVKVHIEETVREIVANYDIDGIHFDDYFYPAGYPLGDGESKDGEEANRRRENVNDMVERVSKVIKETDDSVAFGISPLGIWKNDLSDITGSSTNGGESYYNVYADTRTWIQEEWIDYVVPQIYWEIGHDSADYETLVRWWSNEVSNTDVDLYIGHGLYKESVALEIAQQLAINEKYDQVDGSIFFTMGDILSNSGNSKDQLTTYYNDKIPPQPAEEDSDKLTVVADPNGEIQLVINNELVVPSVTPYIDADAETTLVPVRVVSENLGAFINWDGDNRVITIIDNGRRINLQIDNLVATVDGNEVTLLLAPKIIDDTAMVPIRFISEYLDATVEWEEDNRVIRIDK